MPEPLKPTQDQITALTLTLRLDQLQELADDIAALKPIENERLKSVLMEYTRTLREYAERIGLREPVRVDESRNRPHEYHFCADGVPRFGTTEQLREAGYEVAMDDEARPAPGSA